MAKDKEKQQAYYYYVEKQRTAKETAALVGVTEKSVGDWISRGGWRELRQARALSATSRIDNIESLIDDLARQRIELGRELDEAIECADEKRAAELRRQMASVDDGAGKWNKTLENTKRDGKVRLTVYLDVMEQIFNALREFDQTLFLKTVEFQQQHVHDVSNKIDRV